MFERYMAWPVLSCPVLSCPDCSDGCWLLFTRSSQERCEESEKAVLLKTEVRKDAQQLNVSSIPKSSRPSSAHRMVFGKICVRRSILPLHDLIVWIGSWF